MDRHDLPGLTAEDLARAHASDLQVADKHDVQFLSYWFDADSGGVFCLARAPAPENLVSVHRESHGLVPNEIISVSEDAVLRFLGVVRNPSNHTEVTSSFRTILFTDIEGSTAIADQLGTSGFIALLTEHDLIIRRALVASRGREVKHTGDGIMASFDEVADALECALAIQAGFSARIDGGAKPEYRVRIGMAAGEPVDHNDDLLWTDGEPCEARLRRRQARRRPRLRSCARARHRERFLLRGRRSKSSERIREAGPRLQAAREALRAGRRDSSAAVTDARYRA